MRVSEERKKGIVDFLLFLAGAWLLLLSLLLIIWIGNWMFP